jgi:TFIIF-interacting CTD phosphatase-like protein
MTIIPGNCPLLILDVDETLIYATARPLATPCDFTVGPYSVYKRPFLGPFLATVQNHYQLAVWSSSSADYVSAVLGELVTNESIFQFCWSRSRCTHRYHAEKQDSYWIKDLKKVKRLGYDPRRVLIVDDSPEKVERNYGNAINVRPFEGDPLDRELELLGPYLASLVDVPDFRSVEKRGWRTSHGAE